MLTYCLKCKRNAKKKQYAKMVKTRNGRLRLSSKCAACESKNQDL